jgi:hypothetical protein
MITSDVIALLALALFNLFAAGLCYYNAAIKQIEENKFSFFWHLLGILNVASAIQNSIGALALLG